MRRPLGVIALAIYLAFEGVWLLLVGLGILPLSKFPLRGYWRILSILLGAGFELLAWGLFRLWNWARVAAMFLIFVVVGARLPFLWLRMSQLNTAFFWQIAEILFDLLVVWYLFRSATADHFLRVATQPATSAM